VAFARLRHAARALGACGGIFAVPPRGLVAGYRLATRSLRALAVVAVMGVGLAAAAEPVQRDVAAFPTPAREPFAKLALAVALVGAAGGGLAWWARRRMGPRGADRERIEVLARKSLGPRHHVALVEVAGRRLLIGMGGDAIATLAELDEAPEFAPALAHAAAPLGPGAAARDADLVASVGRFEGLDA
jgi:flagellar biogenesis protein FliO